MSPLLILLIVFVLLLIVIIIVYILSSRNGPTPDYQCLEEGMPEDELVLIKNGNLVATNIPSPNGTYNLTFRNTGGVPFILENETIRPSPNMQVGWTAVLNPNGGGFIKLDTIRDGNVNQKWTSSNGSIFTSDNKYRVSLAPIGGLFYPILVVNQDEFSCKFSFPTTTV